VHPTQIAVFWHCIFREISMKNIYVLLGLLLISSSTFAVDGDPEAGKAKSLTCAACHGTDGNSAIPMNPKIAGQHAGYLYKQLAEFKLAAQTGGAEGRNNAVMNGMAVGLSDQDMKDLAVYYASQEPNIGTAPEEVIAAGKFRSGDRNNDLNGMMRDIASKLTDEDIAILSAYIEGLY